MKIALNFSAEKKKKNVNLSINSQTQENDDKIAQSENLNI